MPTEPEIIGDPGSEEPPSVSRKYVRKLEGENYRLRRDRANLREELAAMKDKVPAEDAARLSEADAADLARYRTAEQCEKAGKIAGFVPSALGRLISADGLTLAFGEETKDGKAAPTVGVKGADGKTTPLADYAARHWGEFMASLKPSEDRPTSSGRAQGTPPRAPARPAPAPGGSGNQAEHGGNILQLLNLGIYH